MVLLREEALPEGERKLQELVLGVDFFFYVSSLLRRKCEGDCGALEQGACCRVFLSFLGFIVVSNRSGGVEKLRQGLC